MPIVHTLLLALRMLAPPEIEPEPETAPTDRPLLELDWRAPPDCVTPSELLARVELLLGRPLQLDGDPDIDLRAEIVRDETELSLHLEFRQPTVREREFRAHSCAELLDAAAMVLAVMIDPLASLNELPAAPTEPSDAPPASEPLPEPEPTPPREPAPEPEPEPEPEPNPPAVTQLGGLVRLGGGVLVPSLPGVAGGPTLALGLRRRALRVELVGAYWASQPARHTAMPELGARISLGTVATRVCGVPRVGPVEFPLCGAVELGGMRGVAFGTPDAVTRTLPWLAIQAGGAASFGVARMLALWVGIDAIAPITRPGFSIDGLGSLHRTPALGFAAILGIEAHFGGDLTDWRRRGQ